MSVYFSDAIESTNNLLLDLSKNQVKGIGFFSSVSNRSNLDDSAKVKGALAITTDASVTKPYFFSSEDTSNWATSSHWKEVVTSGTLHDLLDINSLTSIASAGSSTAVELIRNGNGGNGITFAGHVTEGSQGTVKFTFNQFIEAIVLGMLEEEEGNGFGSVSTFSGAGSAVTGDLDGDGLVGVSDVLTILTFFGGTNSTIPRTVLFKYADDVADSNTSGYDNFSSTLENITNQVIGVITDTDHRVVNTINTGQKSVGVTIDNTSSSATEDMVVFSDTPGSDNSQVLVSALGSAISNGSFTADFGAWTFVWLGGGFITYSLSMKVGRKVGGVWTFSTFVNVTSDFETPPTTSNQIAGGETVIEINEFISPPFLHDSLPGVDLIKVFNAGSTAEFPAANMTDVAVQLAFNSLSNPGTPTPRPVGDVTYIFSVI